MKKIKQFFIFIFGKDVKEILIRIILIRIILIQVIILLFVAMNGQFKIKIDNYNRGHINIDSVDGSLDIDSVDGYISIIN
jgi:hypothetical protein